MPINLQGSSVKLMCGDHEIAKMYCENNVIYSSGNTNTVTYYVDSDTVYQEEVDEGASCLSPKSFTPAKSGWEFVGWRQDNAANSNVLISLDMGDEPITLYAVFRQTITMSYNGNSATSGSTAAQTGYRYYNSSNVANPSFTLRSNSFTRTSYTFSKWALGSAGGTQYAAGASITLSASTTMYAVWTYAGAPFYVVQNYTCKHTLGWTKLSYENLNGVNVKNFTVGDGVYTSLSGQLKDSSEKNSFSMISDSITTKGNKTIRIIANVSNGGATITVNGISKSVPDNSGFSATFDISNATVIQIRASANAYPQSGAAYIQFSEINLY